MSKLPESDRLALMKLLADEDPHVLNLLEQRFIQMGKEGFQLLEAAAINANTDTARGANQILTKLRQNDACETFADFCSTCGKYFDLESACLLLAKTQYPDLDEPYYRTQFNAMVHELKPQIAKCASPRNTVEVCSNYLFHTLKFRGNREEYYDPDNSYINRVIDRKLGIPISLAAVYLIIAQRLELPLLGVGMPGHFLLKWESSSVHFFLDVFNGGKLLYEDECQTLCEAMGHSFNTKSLDPITPRQILLRMCHNLHAIYSETNHERADQFKRFISLITVD